MRPSTCVTATPPESPRRGRAKRGGETVTMSRQCYARLRQFAEIALVEHDFGRIVCERLDELRDELEALIDVCKSAPLEARKAPPPARARVFLWGFTPGSHALSVTRADRRLVVTVIELPEGARAVAVEGPRTADGDTLLGGHTQRIIAQRVTLATAKRRGERFARDWLASAHSAPCPGAESD